MVFIAGNKVGIRNTNEEKRRGTFSRQMAELATRSAALGTKMANNFNFQ